MNNDLNFSQEILEVFGSIPEPISFDETLYNLDLSLIISSI